MSSLLVIDDEPDIHRVLGAALTAAGWKVLSAHTAAQGLRVARGNTVKVTLLDLGLPDVDGKEVIPKLHETNAMSIIVISARHQGSEKIAALDAGADDFVDKPFSIDELLARIRVAERHVPRWRNQDETLAAGELTLNSATRQVTLKGDEVRVSPKEFDLLRELMANAGQVVTHRRLLMAGWGDVTIDPQYLRSYMALLRQKIETDPSEPRLLRSEPGVGYRLMS